jgi:hypothetical protein
MLPLEALILNVNVKVYVKVYKVILGVIFTYYL